MVLDKELALEVLREAKNGEFYDGEIPTEEHELIKLGEFYAKEAKNAYENIAGMKRNKTVKAIINIYSMGIERKSEKAYAQFAGEDVEEVKIDKGLPIPEDLAGDASPMPLDFTDIGDVQLRKLHGEYNAYLARVRWLLSISLNRLASVTHLRDDAYRLAYKQQYLVSETVGSKPTKDVLDAFAKDNEDYKKYDELVRKHQQEVTSFKALVEIYSGNVDRLSREWTMRTDESKRY